MVTDDSEFLRHSEFRDGLYVQKSGANVRFPADPTIRSRGHEGPLGVELPRSGARAGMTADGALQSVADDVTYG